MSSSGPPASDLDTASCGSQVPPIAKKTADAGATAPGETAQVSGRAFPVLGAVGEAHG